MVFGTVNRTVFGTVNRTNLVTERFSVAYIRTGVCLTRAVFGDLLNGFRPPNSFRLYTEWVSVADRFMRRTVFGRPTVVLGHRTMVDTVFRRSGVCTCVHEVGRKPTRRTRSGGRERGGGRRSTAVEVCYSSMNSIREWYR